MFHYVVSSDRCEQSIETVFIDTNEADRLEITKRWKKFYEPDREPVDMEVIEIDPNEDILFCEENVSPDIKHLCMNF